MPVLCDTTKRHRGGIFGEVNPQNVDGIRYHRSCLMSEMSERSSGQLQLDSQVCFPFLQLCFRNICPDAPQHQIHIPPKRT